MTAPNPAPSQAELDATLTLPDGTKAVPIEHHRECHHKLKAALAEVAALRAHIATMDFTKYHAALSRAEALEAERDRYLKGVPAPPKKEVP